MRPPLRYAALRYAALRYAALRYAALRYAALLAFCAALVGGPACAPNGAPATQAPAAPGSTDRGLVALQPYGDGLDVSGSGQVVAARLALDAAGAPVVAWLDGQAGSPQLRLRRLVGGHYQGVAGSDAPAGISAAAPLTDLGLRVDAQGVPCVAWSSAEVPADLGVRCLAGASWAAPGGLAAAPGVDDAAVTQASGIALLGDHDALTALWGAQAPAATAVAGENVWRAYNRRLVAGAWAPSTALYAADRELHNLSGAGGAAGTFVATEAWAAGGDGSDADIYVFGIDQDGAAAAVSPGNVSQSAGASRAPSLAVDAAGQPWVAWVEAGADAGADAAGAIMVARYDGSQWHRLPQACGSVSCGTSGHSPRLAVAADGGAWLAWEDTGPGHRVIYALHYNGTGWAAAAGSAIADGVAGNVADDAQLMGLALDAAGGQPVLAYVLRGDVLVGRLTAAAP